MTSTTTPHRPDGLRVLAAIVIAQVTLIAGAVGWVAIYSYLIAPDQPIAAYQAHAQASGPWVSLILGMPVFFALARWLVRHRPNAARSSAIALGSGYIVIDLTLLLALAPGAIPWGMVAANYGAKLAATWLGSTHGAARAGAAR